MVFFICSFSALVLGEAVIFIFGEKAFGSVYRLPSHHLNHPFLFWSIQAVLYGLVGTAWWQTFSRSSGITKVLTSLSAVWVSILFAAVPCSLLWMHFDFGLFSKSPNQIFDLLPQGFEAAVIIYITSFPFNVVATLLGGLLFMALPRSSSEGSALAYFRTAKSQSAFWNLTKTFLQTVCFWFAFLYLIPQILISFERFFGIHAYRFPGQTELAVLGFALASFGGLWSGATMATMGQGTPLPFDTAAKLVISGPYKFVRNPMALFGLAQGLFVGLYLGSYFIFPYVFLGAWLWNTFVRPVEEAELLSRFGEPYINYCHAVDCWRIRRPVQK